MNGEYKGRVFKESFRGFNKEDVTNFIDSISRMYNTNLIKLEGEVETLRKELYEAGSAGECLSSENEANKKIITELNEKLKVQNENISLKSIEKNEEYQKAKLENASLAEENRNLKKKIDELEDLLNEEMNKVPSADISGDVHFACRAETEILRNENKNLKEQNEQYNADIGRLNESLNDLIRNSENNVITINVEGDITGDKKKAVYDTVMTNLGKIIFSTEKEAGEILCAAKEKANIIISQAENNAGNLLSAANDERDKINLKNNQTLTKIRDRNQRLIVEYSIIKDNAKKDMENLIKNLAAAGEYLAELENTFQP